MRVLPIGDYCLIKLLKGEKMTASGILMPDTLLEKTLGSIDKGEVLAVGRGKVLNGKLIPLGIKIGDRILFSKYANLTYEEANEKYFLVGYDNIIATYED